VALRLKVAKNGESAFKSKRGMADPPSFYSRTTLHPVGILARPQVVDSSGACGLILNCLLKPRFFQPSVVLVVGRDLASLGSLMNCMPGIR